MSKRIRCAIYTRKSTEEGLVQEFNSLDAQREACEAFVQSQRGLNWVARKKRYDDGGISGGTMERPALQELLLDIERGKVDLVVVYKVDRLTRSLTDFSKIIETFDTREISFVSVTQQFNTANSMGRLTLNVLLSFAQFEREVTAERIRDKIAASKKKGMWMGGLPPIGYDAVDKKLLINETEAKTVRFLFDNYVELRSIRKLKEVADRQGIVTKRRQYGIKSAGGKRFTRGHLAQMLHNPIYVGEIAHRDEVYPGQHEAIVSRGSWDAVQQLLDGQAPRRQSATNMKHVSLLAGLVFDETGDRLTPTYAKKSERSYRYYISKRLVAEPTGNGAGWRLPASELENGVIQPIVTFLSEEREWIMAIDSENFTSADYAKFREHIGGLATDLVCDTPATRKQALDRIVDRVVVHPGKLAITFKWRGLMPDGHISLEDPHHQLTVPFLTKRRGVESKMIIGGDQSDRVLQDHNLMETVCRSFEWWHLFTEEEGWSINKLAKHSSMDASNVTRYLPLAFLAPDIVEAIYTGTQPVDLNVERLKKIGPIPVDWAQQRRLLGFESASH